MEAAARLKQFIGRDGEARSFSDEDIEMSLHTCRIVRSLFARFTTVITTCLLIVSCGSKDTTLAVPKGDSAATAPPTARPASTETVRADAQYELAATLAADGYLDSALAVFQRGASLDSLHLSLAAGVTTTRDAISGRVPREAIQRMFSAMRHSNAGRWPEAHADAAQAVKLAPAYVRAHDTRAKVFLFEGKNDEAIAAFNRALQVDPKFAEGYYNRGATYAEMGRHDAAIADYNRAIELLPTFSDAYSNRGSAYTFKNDAQAAMADYTKAHELYPAAVEPLYLRGVLHALLGEWSEATADYTMALARDPTHAPSYYDRGLAFQNQGNDDGALADYTKAIELNQANPAALINRGLLFMRRKQYAPAIADFDKALLVKPVMVVAFYNRALALDQSGRTADAIEAYRTFLQHASAENAAAAKHARERISALQK